MTDPIDETRGQGSDPTPAERDGDDRHARWMTQLQTMIDEVTTAAAPTVRELGAKAAELAARAADAAGPFAHRAAGVTSDVGQRVASRGREIATDLRRPAGPPEAASGASDAEGGDTPA